MLILGETTTKVLHDSGCAFCECGWSGHLERVSMKLQFLDSFNETELWWHFADVVVAQIKARDVFEACQIINVDFCELR